MVNIGSLIREKIKMSGKTVKWVAAEMSMDRSNLYDIFDRQSIDTALLQRFSKVIGFDFIKHLAVDSGIVEEPKTNYEKSPTVVIKIVDGDAEIVDDDFMNAINEFVEYEYQKRKKKKIK